MSVRTFGLGSALPWGLDHLSCARLAPEACVVAIIGYYIEIFLDDLKLIPPAIRMFFKKLGAEVAKKSKIC